MKEITVTTKDEKTGEVYSGTVIMPDNLLEAIEVFSEEEVYSLFKAAYMIKIKQKLKKPAKLRERTLKIKESQIPPEALAILKTHGII